MDISKLLGKYYSNNEWCCGNTYETLKWYDTETPKPTKEHIESLWKELFKDKMREERNKLLKESDFMMLSDYPHTNKEAWVLYRQQLRDFPAVWTEGTPFPTPPE
jgi:hypothetical protein